MRMYKPYFSPGSRSLASAMEREGMKPLGS